MFQVSSGIVMLCQVMAFCVRLVKVRLVQFISC